MKGAADGFVPKFVPVKGFLYNLLIVALNLHFYNTGIYWWGSLNPQVFPNEIEGMMAPVIITKGLVFGIAVYLQFFRHCCSNRMLGSSCVHLDRYHNSKQCKAAFNAGCLNRFRTFILVR